MLSEKNIIFKILESNLKLSIIKLIKTILKKIK